MDGLNTDYDSLILQVLQGPRGLTTGLIAGACKPYLGQDRQVHSRYIRNRLLALQEVGKVRRMDDLKPVCWVLTSP